ncbi:MULTISPECIES: AraC family transcriptional regulator [Paraburkholderia]|uniref:AraC family transcriptional regulator n=1 Tax=Paraburkholderia TaxID=1822464 RepID=UPI001CAE5626|nr:MULTISPECIES: AraC family transcriptional regulator [Paraburkholderia]CAG9221833.1 L-rhamnose operon transcriptional activator RhaR [Paraburkholderia caribensis]
MKRENFAKLWQEHDFGNAEMLRAAYRSHRFPPHSHDEFAIGFIERGAQEFIYVAGERVMMPKGKICVINPGAVHEGGSTTDGGWDYRMIYISRSELERVLVDANGNSMVHGLHFTDTVIEDRETLRLIHAAHACSECKQNSRLEVASKLTQCIFQLVERHGRISRKIHLGTPVPAAVKRAREYIDANVADNPSLTTLAAVAGISTFHLLREFKRVVGVAPHAYLIQRRIELAKHLYLKGKSLRRVAIEVGYYDQGHLSREFSRFFGVPPSATR